LRAFLTQLNPTSRQYLISFACSNYIPEESAWAKVMAIVKRTLNKYGYPPDKQQKAVDTVLKQAEVFADFWVEH